MGKVLHTLWMCTKLKLNINISTKTRKPLWYNITALSIKGIRLERVKIAVWIWITWGFFCKSLGEVKCSPGHAYWRFSAHNCGSCCHLVFVPASPGIMSHRSIMLCKRKGLSQGQGVPQGQVRSQKIGWQQLLPCYGWLHYPTGGIPALDAL